MYDGCLFKLYTGLFSYLLDVSCHRRDNMDKWMGWLICHNESPLIARLDNYLFFFFPYNMFKFTWLFTYVLSISCFVCQNSDDDDDFQALVLLSVRLDCLLLDTIQIWNFYGTPSMDSKNVTSNSPSISLKYPKLRYKIPPIKVISNTRKVISNTKQVFYRCSSRWKWFLSE